MKKKQALTLIIILIVIEAILVLFTITQYSRLSNNEPLLSPLDETTTAEQIIPVFILFVTIFVIGSLILVLMSVYFKAKRDEIEKTKYPIDKEQLLKRKSL